MIKYTKIVHKLYINVLIIYAVNIEKEKKCRTTKCKLLMEVLTGKLSTHLNDGIMVIFFYKNDYYYYTRT